MWDVVLDALLDTLKLFPFLFVLYILIELLEHKTRMGKPMRALTNRKIAPVLGSATGLLPMCGFSVMAAKLYERKYLTVGTLIAVFIATSDEALLVLALSSLPIVNKVVSIVLLLGCKLIIGAGVGYLADCFSGKGTQLLPLPEEHEHEHGHEHEHEHEHGHDEGDVHNLQACDHKHESNVQVYFVSPLLHALKIAAVILLFNLAFGALFFAVGEERVVEVLQGTGLWFQPLFCCFIGLVPNCASSVILAETYAFGGITFGSLLGGLVSNAGLGALVLFKNKREWKRNVLIVLAIFLCGMVVAYVGNAISLVLP